MKRLDVVGNPYIGVFCAANDRLPPLPKLVPRATIRHMKEEGEAIGAAFYPLPHRLNAVGNNVLCNDQGAVVHPGYDDDAIAIISDVLGVPAVPGTIAGIRTVGSVAGATNRGVLCHPHAKPGEIEAGREALKVPVLITTANYGAAQVGACMVANSRGAVVGSRTTPIELGRIEEGLGLF